MSTVLYNPSYQGSVVQLRPQQPGTSYALPFRQPQPTVAPTAPSPVPVYQTPQPAPFTAPSATPSTTAPTLSSDEQTMINLVNQQRSLAGVRPVVLDSRLMTIARTKALDMKTNHYFGHISPTYGTPWAMMQAAGITVRWGGENIATQKTVSGAMASFMASPGHRANILDSRMTHIGVGMAYATSYGTIYVQEFVME